MTVSVTMLQSRRGEDGNIWVAGQSYPASVPFAEFLINSNFATGTLPPAPGRTAEAKWALLPAGAHALLLPDGSVAALYEPWTVATLTATGNAATAPCEYGGIKVRAVSGTVNLQFFDALSATGTAIDTISAISLTGGPSGNGFYPWAGPGAARETQTGLHVEFAGGGSATVDVLRRLL